MKSETLSENGNSAGKIMHTSMGFPAREYWEAAAVQQEETVEFVFRWKPYFDQMDKRTHRLVFRGKIFDIQHIDNVRYRNQTVKIKAVTNNGTEDKK